MSARVDQVLRAVAEELGLEIAEALGGGEFGAVLVHDRDGEELVLKAMPGEVWAPRFARGARLAARVRSADYPVPHHRGTGVAAGASWSLQERLPGAVPDTMTAAHARRLLDMLRYHRDAADHAGDVAGRFRQELGDAVAQLTARPDTAALGRELAAALATVDEVEVRHGDVVHGDFHHRNYLAVDDRVTGVFDWELAWAGDWRVDLVNLACWGSWVPWQIPPEVNTLAVAAARAACPPRVLALFTAFHTLRALAFNVRHHPDRIPWLVESVDATTRSWLRPSAG